MATEDAWEEDDSETMWESEDRQEALMWLVNMMSGKDLWMDGTMQWTLPLSVLSGIRACTALDAIIEAKRRYDEWTKQKTQP